MQIFEIYQRRTASDDLVRAGSILAPDLEMARLLARETHFRHAEAECCYVKYKGEMHEVAATGPIGGAIDRSYRRQDGYIGVGARMRRLSESLAAKGMIVEGARPSDSAKASHG